jgi:putative transcriptional regulator
MWIFIDFMEKIYNRIKAVLAEEGKTNMWLADKLSMSPNTVSKWCTNHMQPTIETLFRIAAALEVDARTLLVASKK